MPLRLPDPKKLLADRATLLFYALLTALTGLALWPVWATDILPVVDSSPHLHLIQILHNFDRDPLLQRHYVKVDAIVPYLTYYKAVDWLAYLVDLETANRIFLSLCLAALPVSALALLRAAGHSRWLVLGVMPWLLNPDFFMGFFNFLMSIPLFLWLLAAHLRLLQQPRWWRAALVAGLLCFMATTHYLLWAISLVLLPLLALVIGTRRGWLQAIGWPLREVLLGLPSIGVLAPWFLRYFVFAEGVVTSDQALTERKGNLLERFSHVFLGVQLGPIANISQLFDQMFDALDPPGAPSNLLYRQGELISVLWLVGLGLWLLGTAMRRPEPDMPPTERRWGDTYTAWAFVLLLAAYFLLPQHLLKPIWLWGVNFRLAEVLAVLAVVALPLDPLRPPTAVRLRVWLGTALMAICAVALPLATVHGFRLARAEYGDIRRAMAAIPRGKAVLLLRHSVSVRSLKYPIFNGLTEWYAVMRGGYVPYSFADTSSKPVVLNRATALPAPPWDAQNQFSWPAHGRYYDYIVVFRAVAGKRDTFEEALPADLQFVYGDRLWRVYRNPVRERWPLPTLDEMAQETEQFAQESAQRRLTTEALAAVGLPVPPTRLDDGVLAPWLEMLPGVERLQPLLSLGWPPQPAPVVSRRRVWSHRTPPERAP